MKCLHDEEQAVLGKSGRALWPESPGNSEPALYREPESPRCRVRRVSRLLRKSRWAEQRNPGRAPSQGKAFPHKPHVKVHYSRCVLPGLQ